MNQLTTNIFFICLVLIIFISPINLKAESSHNHCHCINAQQQTFEYIEEADSNEISQSKKNFYLTIPKPLNEKSLFTTEVGIQERPENIWNIVNKGYRIPDPKKKWAKKVVKKYERWYSEHPVYTYRMFERAKRYIYYVVHEVKKRNMPMEIALLPIIESAYNPIARSNAKAVGLWQFIPSTGKNYGLKQNWWKDERSNVILSTNASLNYLEKLYKQFGTWELALAAYNAGEGKVSREIKKNKRRKRATDYYTISLPRETDEYVSKLIAMKHIIQNPSKYNVEVLEIPNEPYFGEVTITEQMDIDLILKLADISSEEFELLNAHHKRPLIPKESQPTTILLPQYKINTYSKNLAEHDGPLSNWILYKPKRRESIMRVAKKFDVNLSTFKRINNLNGRVTFRRNSTVLIPKSNELKSKYTLKGTGDFNYTSVGTHHVSKGDTLGGIARKYKVSIEDLKEFNELDSHIIIIGTTIDIPQ
ncbi:MAG: transglycosylase SLT domain-containing protein [Nitrosomonadales bacterium]|jgi:membrane-bound lytic murein transglycosylase D|nr:transglycosylase SLT domain-containing protein [Nitrosomonadales bacterium]MBT3917790.1 transglycosylase SLT domain-containing protein [Nitrosomonadales bacterium]MBT4571313.1 transglycosylase SLT domain-containing protein [Nitrosomonadales bacterium]MBT4759502.1 transglycosylase SLT domain-containing protein [Nitrosomonadales bacterium]MBT6602731.1 transglycosylase SLT domain-containing protein [Nitrosomonadales bacterium]